MEIAPAVVTQLADLRLDPTRPLVVTDAERSFGRPVDLSSPAGRARSARRVWLKYTGRSKVRSSR